MGGDDELELAYEEILGTVSHDLRNPIGTLVMASSALAAGASDDDPRSQRLRAVLERIQRQTEKLARLVDNLADFSTGRTGKLVLQRTIQPIDGVVAAAVAAMVPVVQDRAIVIQQGVIQPGVIPLLPDVSCDLARVAQLAAALAGLAAKGSPKASRLDVAARLEGTVTALVLTLPLPGLDDAHLPDLFSPTWRSPVLTYRGAGLALGLARAIATAHDGVIRAERAPEGAVAFVITFGAS